MKKLISVLLCLLFVFSLSACGGKTPGESSGDIDTSENKTSDGNEKTTGESSGDIGTSENKTSDGNEKTTGESTEKKENESTTEAKELPDIVKKSKVTETGAYELYKGIYIYDISPYSGKFVEDGTDDELKDIMSVSLINTTDKSYQMIDFTLLLPQGKYSFSAKTILPNSSLVVLEKDRNFMPPKTKNFSAEVTDVINFNENPSVHLDKFEITYTDKIINVKNITDEDFENVYVYFKGIKDDVFFGGITYRVAVGSVPAGQIIQTVAERFSPDSMKIVFVTYA